MSLINLFYEFCLIGISTFGGGNNVIPEIRRIFLDKNNLLSEEDIIEASMLANILPGPSMIETATIIGFKVKKIPGAIIAGLAISILPLLIFILGLILISHNKNSNFILKLLYPVSIVLAISMFNLSLKMLENNDKTWGFCLLVITTIFAYYLLHLPIPIIMLIGITYSLSKTYLKEHKKC